MVDRTDIVQGPWPEPSVEPARGKRWRLMWTPAADALHRECERRIERGGPDASSIVSGAVLDLMDWGYGVVDAGFIFGAWLDEFAPQGGTQGLVRMLELRAKARGWVD